MESIPWVKLAGKFKDEAPANAAYHPLACHMVDVGAVALALWDQCLPRSARDLLAVQFGLEHEECRRWVAFLAALHDLGKASRPFQAKDRNHAARLASTGLTAYLDPGMGHGKVGAHFIPRYLESVGVEGRLAATLGTILGGHHGSFPIGSSRLTASDLQEDDGHPFAGDWEAARRDLFNAVRDVMDLPRNRAGETIVPTKAPDGTAQMFLAGFVSIADWIGSIDDPGFFEYDPEGADDLPSFDLDFNGSRCTTNPLGVKGAGEAAMGGIMPAILNAVSDALGGVAFDGPATAERVWRAMRSRP